MGLYEHINLDSFKSINHEISLLSKFDNYSTYNDVLKIKKTNKSATSKSVDLITSKNSPGNLLNLIFQSWANSRLPVIHKDHLSDEIVKDIKTYYQSISNNFINNDNIIRITPLLFYSRLEQHQSLSLMLYLGKNKGSCEFDWQSR